jgi:hypothetical protein
MVLVFVFAMSLAVLFGSCTFLEFITGDSDDEVQIGFTQPTGEGRFYNARVIRDFTLNLADGVEASCRGDDERIMETGDMVRQLRALGQDIDDAIYLFNDTPESNARMTNAIDAAARAGRPAYYKMMTCGGNPPEVPRVPGYFETFWDIAS